MADGRLAGRRALVTGASSGIGEATARLLDAEGARLALLSRRAGELQRVAADLTAAVAVPADVSDHRQAIDALDAAEAQIGPVDILVNCAGVIGPLPLDDLTPQIWDQTLAINLSGPFYLGREAGLRMRGRGGGHIVNVASDLAFTAMPGYVDYCRTGPAAVMLSDRAATESPLRTGAGGRSPPAVRARHNTSCGPVLVRKPRTSSADSDTAPGLVWLW